MECCSDIEGEEMKIVDAIKNKDLSLRVSNGDTWMYWDETTEEWIVLFRPYGAKKNREMYRGGDEDEAVNILMRE